jgi:hypothetical protein
MKFCISTLTYFNSLGFDTVNWRISVDGTLAIAHENFISVLCPDYQSDVNITVYECPSDELTTLLNSSAWSK